jgi:hypothetical protein
MPRIKYATHDCPDKGQRWDTTSCLCDCHYRSGSVCGDVDAESQPRRIRVTRRPRRSEAWT